MNLYVLKGVESSVILFYENTFTQNFGLSFSNAIYIRLENQYIPDLVDEFATIFDEDTTFCTGNTTINVF